MSNENDHLSIISAVQISTMLVSAKCIKVRKNNKLLADT